MFFTKEKKDENNTNFTKIGALLSCHPSAVLMPSK